MRRDRMDQFRRVLRTAAASARERVGRTHGSAPSATAPTVQVTSAPSAAVDAPPVVAPARASEAPAGEVETPGPQDAHLRGEPPAAVYEHRRQTLRLLTEAGIVSFGAGSYGTPDVLVYGGDDGRLVVGAYSSIADDVQILVGGNHRTDRASTYPFRARYDLPGKHTDGFPSTRGGGVLVGSDVWIGRGALVVSGSRIGDGAIVAAGAVVAGEVRPYAVVVGNPAREVRRRFDDDTVDRLLEMRWWDWPLEELLGIVDLLNDEDVTALLHYGAERATAAAAPNT